MGFIREGKLRPLCVTSLKRSPALPDLPTSIEAGYKDSNYNFWNGLLLPAKTPRPVVDRIHAEVTAVLAAPDVQKKLSTQGVEPSPVTPAEYDRQIRQEVEDNIKIAQAAGLQAR
jgi:tripartite-type tricarboxylate transporter receptor subunit TctC